MDISVLVVNLYYYSVFLIYIFYTISFTLSFEEMQLLQFVDTPFWSGVMMISSVKVGGGGVELICFQAIQPFNFTLRGWVKWVQCFNI